MWLKTNSNKTLIIEIEHEHFTLSFSNFKLFHNFFWYIYKFYTVDSNISSHCIYLLRNTVRRPRNLLSSPRYFRALQRSNVSNFPVFQFMRWCVSWVLFVQTCSINREFSRADSQLCLSPQEKKKNNWVTFYVVISQPVSSTVTYSSSCKTNQLSCS